MIGFVQRLDAVNLEDRSLLKMILQVAAHPGPVVQRCDTELGEPVGRSDTGELQDQRRSDGAGRQDDLSFGPRLEKPAVLPELDADRALAVEQNLFDEDAGLETEIGPPEHRLQEGAGGGPAE